MKSGENPFFLFFYILAPYFIENAAFYKCNGFSSLDLGNTVTSIGTSAFWGCFGLTGS
ncbi:MAG: leucine-rich repeat protein, partial [Schwartzia sp.]|nr:leucine-rich repeat protein [Schwartzia sp. (in: firmicutes)]